MLKQRPVPCPHIPSVKGGWPDMANPHPTGYGARGKTGASSRRSLGDRLNKGKDVKHNKCHLKSFRLMLVQAVQIVI